jgi:hypothetical protein
MDSQEKLYRERAIGNFSNVRYIIEKTPDKTIDELLELGKY